MTNIELLKKYENFRNSQQYKYIDYDGYYGPQCFDLAQKYMVEVLGVPASVLGGCEIVANMILREPDHSELMTYFDEVSIYAMNPGDLVIWESNHIAIFDHWDGFNCWYFSQNPNAPVVMQCHMSGMHAYRLKGLTTEQPVSEESNEEQTIEIPTEALANNLEKGNYVKIIGYGNASSYGDGKRAVPGYEGTITNIYAGRPFPYEVSDYEGVLGYYPANSLSK